MQLKVIMDCVDQTKVKPTIFPMTRILNDHKCIKFGLRIIQQGLLVFLSSLILIQFNLNHHISYDARKECRLHFTKGLQFIWIQRIPTYHDNLIQKYVMSFAISYTRAVESYVRHGFIKYYPTIWNYKPPTRPYYIVFLW